VGILYHTDHVIKNFMNSLTRKEDLELQFQVQREVLTARLPRHYNRDIRLMKYIKTTTSWSF